MSIGFLKRLLLLLNVTAVLMISGAAYAFVSHREEMREPFHPPTFAIPIITSNNGGARISDIGIPLGNFPKKVEAPTEVNTPDTKPDIESVLSKLGSIKAAIVAYEPYDSIKPAIIFELTGQGGKMRTIHVGEALESRDHPKYGSLVQIPVHYLFVRCEPDPENPDWTYFVFDMNCDGKDIQKAHWKGEGEEAKAAAAVTAGAEPAETGGSTFQKNRYIFGEEVEEAEKPVTKPVEPEVKPADEPQPVPVEPEPFTDRPSTIFEEDSAGSLALTDDGVDYLRDNYENVLKEARTRTYTDPKTNRPSGVRIVAIKPGSVANEFGIRSDDIIVSINDRPVTKQSQAVNIVKSELNKKNVRYIRVKLLRQGREMEKRFDTRDRETRNKARDAFRDRR